MTSTSGFAIRPMAVEDIPAVTAWARREGFCPGPHDVAILRHADRTGVWVGCLDGEPVGCIIGVRWDRRYGFLGLFLVRPEHRGHGYGVALWRRALEHLDDVACIGLEAAPERVDDYAGWGFRPAWDTCRWSLPPAVVAGAPPVLPAGHRLVSADAVPETVVQAYDARHEATPRPHFLREWLREDRGGEGSASPAAVWVVQDGEGRCRGFGRIRPCLLPPGGGQAGSWGWRVGPWIADTPAIAAALLDRLRRERPGPVLVDAPQDNVAAGRLLERNGFRPVSRTVRMYRGTPPPLPIGDLYGLACLELG